MDRFPHVMFGPFPHEIEAGPIWYLSSLSTFHFWLTIVFATIYMLRNKRHWLIALGLFSLALMSLAVFTLILTNYGILIRFRVVTELLLAPLAISGLLCLKESWAISRTNPSGIGVAKARASTTRYWACATRR